jgi:molybdopterin-containing oxidoreductase family iron-sulfur binding subunit
MPPLDDTPTGQRYWRSLDELANTEQFRTFVENEFPNFAPELLNGPTRRGFLKVMGASLALAGLAGCRWPREKILPYANRPDNRIPGVPVQYATAMEVGGWGQGLLVSSLDGRPIKVEGNDQHPLNAGATDAFGQASVLDLYDPDRTQRHYQPTADGPPPQRLTFAAFLNATRAHFDTVRQNDGRGFFVLSEASSSPTLAATRERFLEVFPQARWLEYEALSRDNVRAGTAAALGTPYRPSYDLTQADVIVSIDEDFLLQHPESIRLTREFARRRRPGADNNYDMNRLYAFESGLSLTGCRADSRESFRPTALPGLVGQLLSAVRDGQPAEGPMSTRDVQLIADDLRAHRGRSVVMAGAHLPADVHAAVTALNAALGNLGTTVRLLPEPAPERPSHRAALEQLTNELNAGGVETLLILGGNPVHTAPADLDFEAALANAGMSLHLGLYEDETSRACDWHLARSHYLESWGDTQAYDGTVSIIQPLIAPLHDPPQDVATRTPAELLAALAEDRVVDDFTLVRDTFRKRFAPADEAWETAWQEALHRGIIADTAAEPVTPPAVQTVPLPRQPGASGYDLVFTADPSVYDGRFANNGWLQELPDPLTKLTWDNAAIISPVDAKALGVKRGDLLRIELGGRSLEIPAFVQPGQPQNTLTLPVGYGTRLGLVSANTGFDTYSLLADTAPGMATGATVAKASGTYLLATTQDHSYMDVAIGETAKRQRAERFIREEDLETFRSKPNFVEHVVHLPLFKDPAKAKDAEGAQAAKEAGEVVHEDRENFGQLFGDVDYIGENQWAMAIDLSACTGCNACIIACQAENNIPVVGKLEVHRGREMHWIRVDRYFKGTPERVTGVAHQPVTCHHCENAPCEQVCPVAATVHDEEGLNAMVYNRCIGTRYCSNNCPYKVRRFNWFYNHHGPHHPRDGQDVSPMEQMLFNPRVTVRSRGVMEKCTFCTQRINDVRIKVKNARIKQNDPSIEIEDGMVTPACAQTCPAEAITFGDRSDRASRVHQLIKNNPRGYYLLQELNVRPRLKYLARINNPLTTAGGGQDEHDDGGTGGGHG